MTSCIEVDHLVKQYGEYKAVNKLTFNVKSGEIFGLLGPNGAGKSTTIEMLIGLRKRDNGSILINNSDPGLNPQKVKEHIGVQLQSSSLINYLKVKEIIKLFASFYKNSLPINQVIQMVGLNNKSDYRISKLSGGQQQKVAVAIALVSNGDIIFLDEPTTGLDPQSRHELWDELLRLKEQNKTIFLTTHFMDEAEYLCDRVGIIDKGKIIALDTPEKLIDTYFQERAIEIKGNELDNNVLSKIENITKIEKNKDKYILYSNQVTYVLDQLFNSNDINYKIDNINIRQATLEDVFLKLTGRYLNSESIY